jgi:hypothetical protein
MRGTKSARHSLLWCQLENADRSGVFSTGLRKLVNKNVRFIFSNEMPPVPVPIHPPGNLLAGLG